jgi:hypothetical protein
MAFESIAWEVFPPTATSEKPRGDRQQMVASLHIKRKAGWFTWNIFVALFFINSTSVGMFFLPARDIVDRLATGLAVIVNAIAYKWVISERLYVPFV